MNTERKSRITGTSTALTVKVGAAGGGRPFRSPSTRKTIHAPAAHARLRGWNLSHISKNAEGTEQ